MPEEGAEEKSERGTEKRRSEAREKGQVAKSQEIVSVAVLLVSLLALYYTGMLIVNEIYALMRGFFGKMASADLTPGGISVISRLVAISFFKLIGPFLMFLLLGSIAANVLQTGFLFTSEPLTPDFNKLNPLSGFKKIFFSKRTIGEVVKGMLKIAFISYIVYGIIEKEMSSIPPLTALNPRQIFMYIVGVSGDILYRVSIALIFLAVLDFAFQKYQFEESIKMTKQEIKEETKQTEGDPHVKSRIRTVQRQMARRRMMADVSKADVVITNPTHIAVALEYKVGMEAPKLLAKGERLVAERIKEKAREHGIPIVEDKPLARAIYKDVEIGDVVPPTFYRAIAEVLAYVMKLGKLKNRDWGM